MADDNFGWDSFARQTGVMRESKDGVVSARQLREEAATNNPMSRIPSSNNPPRNEEENNTAKAIVEKWAEELSKAIASAHHQAELKKLAEVKTEE